MATKPNPERTFKAKAPGIMRQLMADFPIDTQEAAAIVGNLGYECMGFTAFQELAPTVKGSRGGWGWPQWTGPRRRAFERWCKRTRKDPASDEANYGYLFLELKGLEGSEGAAIGKLRSAPNDLKSQVIAFELAFLRAGKKNYEGRLRYAMWAIEAWRDEDGEEIARSEPAEAPVAVPAVERQPNPPPPPTPVALPAGEASGGKRRLNWMGIGLLAGVVILAAAVAVLALT